MVGEGPFSDSAPVDAQREFGDCSSIDVGTAQGVGVEPVALLE